MTNAQHNFILNSGLFFTEAIEYFSSEAALISLKFYWSCGVAVATVLGARGIVPVICSFVLSKGSEQFMCDLAGTATRPKTCI